MQVQRANQATKSSCSGPTGVKRVSNKSQYKGGDHEFPTQL